VSAPNPPRRSGGQIAAIVVGALTALLAVGALTAGAALLWADGHKGRDGYLSTSTERFHTNTSALATDDIDLNTDGPDWVTDDLLGRVRIRATSQTGKPIFVGIARTADVDAYLRGTSHTTVTDVDAAPFRASYRAHRGGRPAPPALQRFWTVSSSGRGRQAVDWKVADGTWSVVVMNADGSPRVAAGVSAATDAPWLSGAGWVTVGGGALLAAIAGGLLYAGARRPRIARAPAEPSEADVAPAAA
jgi:hypothetical protein